jgi:hypothetical protein
LLSNKSFHTECRPPIKVGIRIVAVAECGRNGNDSLMHVVTQGDEDVYNRD